MVSIECNISVLKELIQEKISEQEIENILWNLGYEVEDKEGDVWKIDITPDRPDLFSVFGIARLLRCYLNGKKKDYKFEDSGLEVIVDKSVKEVRPYTVCAVAKNLRLTEDTLKSLISLQEKIHLSYARKRKKAAIGIYPLEVIKGPIRFIAKKPEDIKFVPLDFEEELSGREILEKHPKGMEYGHLLKGKEKYPIFIDADGRILSMPPIINSRDTGKVTLDTKEIFIECSGHDLNFLNKVMNILVSNIAEIGDVCSVKVKYPDRELITPHTEEKVLSLQLGYANKLLGINIGKEDAIKLLKRIEYEVSQNSDKDSLKVIVPWYRVDVFSQVDIIEDLGKAYGIDNLSPEFPMISTIGKKLDKSFKIDKIRELMLGYGFQELYNMVLSSVEDQIEKMNIEKENNILKIEGARESTVNVARIWLLPELLKFLSKNQHHQFPIKIFEIGEVLFFDEKVENKAREEIHLSAAILNSKVGYEDIAGVIVTLFKILGAEIEFKRASHKSFIEGRVAEIMVNGKKRGLVGEIHPKVLKNFGIDFPVVGTEIELSFIISDRK